MTFPASLRLALALVGALALTACEVTITDATCHGYHARFSDEGGCVADFYCDEAENPLVQCEPDGACTCTGYDGEQVAFDSAQFCPSLEGAGREEAVDAVNDACGWRLAAD